MRWSGSPMHSKSRPNSCCSRREAHPAKDRPRHRTPLLPARMGGDRPQRPHRVRRLPLVPEDPDQDPETERRPADGPADRRIAPLEGDMNDNAYASTANQPTGAATGDGPNGPWIRRLMVAAHLAGNKALPRVQSWSLTLGGRATDH